MKIYHLHFHEKNVGDKAIIQSIQDLLGTKFDITEYSKKELYYVRDLPYPKLVHSFLKRLPFVEKVLPQFIKNILINYRDKQDSKLIKEINSHDLVILGGGGLFSNVGLPIKPVFLNKITKPLITFGGGYNQVIGTETKEDVKKGAKELIKKAALVSVRDKETKEFLSSLYDRHISIIPDPAIFLQNELIEPLPQDKQKLHLGINFAYHAKPSKDKIDSGLLDLVVETIKNKQKKYDLELYYLVHAPDELPIFEKLKKSFPAIHFCYYKNPKQLKSLYGQLDLVICMMLHSSILSFAEETPFISIAYDKKNYAFMKKIDYQDYCLDINKINKDLLSQKFDQLEFNSKNISQHFSQQKQLLFDELNIFLAEVVKLSKD